MAYLRSDGRWAEDVPLPGSSRFKRRKKTVYGKSSTEAKKKARTLSARIQAGLTTGGANQSLGSWLRTWLITKMDYVQPATYERYESAIRIHLIPDLGHFKLEQLTASDLRNYYRRKSAEGCAPRSLKQHSAVLGSSLKMAYQDGLLARNPHSGVMAPKIEQHQPDTYTREEVRAILQASRGTSAEAIVLVAASTGLRLGELTALKWKDLNEVRKTVDVRRSLYWDSKGRSHEKIPKTHSSKRQISLTSAVLLSLRAHRRQQSEQRLTLGAAWQDNDYMFSTGIGTPINPGNFYSRVWYPLIAGAGVKRLTPHGMRHSLATLLAESGEHPRAVASLLGHSSVKTTLDIYTAFTNPMRDSLVKATESITSA